jgi:hypothetical protein
MSLPLRTFYGSIISEVQIEVTLEVMVSQSVMVLSPLWDT